MGEGRVLLCGIAFALLPRMFLPSRLSTTVSLAPQGDMMRERGVVKVVHQAERKDAMQQVIVSRNDKEEVWVETPTRAPSCGVFL